MRWCSNAGDWAVVLLMRGNGWLARWSWWLISFLEPYHNGSQRYESDPCICDVQIWGLLKKHWQTIVETTSTDCFCCLLLITDDYSTYREPSINQSSSVAATGNISPKPFKRGTTRCPCAGQASQGWGPTDLPGTANSKPSPPLAVAGFQKECFDENFRHFNFLGGSENTSPPGTTSEMKRVSSWFGFDSGFLFDTFLTKSWGGGRMSDIIFDLELAIFWGRLDIMYAEGDDVRLNMSHCFKGPSTKGWYMNRKTWISGQKG